jgi:hypothetical protein
MSFLKKSRQNRLKLSKFGTILLSIPIALAFINISACFLTEFRHLQMKFAVPKSIGSSLDNSEDQTFVLKFYQQTPN